MHTTSKSNRCKKPKQSYAANTPFVAPNPPTTFNPKSVGPTIDSTAYVGAFSTIIGDVTIGENVFIAPSVTIRADEGSPFFIDSNTNLQDGVILHGLANGRVMYHDNLYSIYIGKGVSCAHGCIIHGPCMLGDNVFVGFRSIVLNAIIQEDCYISHNALVTGGITVAPNRFVPAGAVVDTQEKANALGLVSHADYEFAQDVQFINQEFPSAYRKQFGSSV